MQARNQTRTKTPGTNPNAKSVIVGLVGSLRLPAGKPLLFALLFDTGSRMRETRNGVEYHI